MPHSVIQAIQQGIWDFEPEEKDAQQFPGTDALPGTQEKLAVLANRLHAGLPLWHPSDRLSRLDLLTDS